MFRSLSLAALVVSGVSANQCNVALLDDPLDFKTLYTHRGGHKAQSFPPGTNDVCNYYASSEYASPPGACCTGNFVDNVVQPLMNKVLDLGKVSAECKQAVQRVACFACARGQTKFLSIDFDVADLQNSTADISLCRSTCHTVWTHCKNDAIFQIDGTHMITEQALCTYLSNGVIQNLAKKGSRATVSIVEDEAMFDPTCFLYDDLTPTPNQYVPPSLSDVKPSTKTFQIVFNERITRKEKATGNTQPRLIQLVEVNSGNEGGKTKVIASIDADAPKSQTKIQIVTTTFVDDTLQLVFEGDDDDDKNSCLLNSKENTQYEILVGDDILRDRSGNVFQGVASKTWSFKSDASTGCNGDKGRMSPIAIGVTVGCLVVLLLGGVVSVVCIKRRQDAQNSGRQFVDLGSDVTAVDSGPVREGSMVETRDGAKMQVRFVPAYQSPDGMGGVQEEQSGHAV